MNPTPAGEEPEKIPNNYVNYAGILCQTVVFDEEITMKLKKEGEKLTGTVNIRDMDVQIEKGECKDGMLSFQVSPEFNGTKFVVKYQGKVSGVRRVEYYPPVFDGATHCDVAVNTTAIKGARVTAAVFSS